MAKVLCVHQHRDRVNVLTSSGAVTVRATPHRHDSRHAHMIPAHEFTHPPHKEVRRGRIVFS